MPIPLIPYTIHIKIGVEHTEKRLKKSKGNAATVKKETENCSDYRRATHFKNGKKMKKKKSWISTVNSVVGWPRLFFYRFPYPVLLECHSVFLPAICAPIFIFTSRSLFPHFASLLSPVHLSTVHTYQCMYLTMYLTGTIPLDPNLDTCGL